MRALPFFLAVSALTAVPAQAQELNRGTQWLELAGSADPACVAGSGRAVRQDNASYQDGGPSGGTVVITEMVDPTTAASRGSAIELALPLTCNTSHTITVRSYNGGLLRDGASAANQAGGFSEFQGYGVTMAWQSQSLQIGGATGTATLAYAQPAKGDLVVDIAVPRGTQPLVAGTYRDAVVVEIRPSN
jgi:spore coat protein U-like protein